MNLRNVPEDVRQQFKAVCALRNTTMTELIVELMRQEIARDETIRGAVGAGVVAAKKGGKQR